jgi:hypothetical protein
MMSSSMDEEAGAGLAREMEDLEFVLTQNLGWSQIQEQAGARRALVSASCG